MGSDPSPPGLLAGLGANPYFWLGLAGLFGGFFLGEAGAWLLATLKKAGPRRRSRHSAWAVTGLALALLSGVGLLVLTPRGSIPSVLASGYAYPWLGLAGAMGLVLGLVPPLGMGLTLLACLASWGLVADARASWLPLAAPLSLARLLPIGNSGATWVCELAVYQKDSVPTTARLELASPNACLVVERLDLLGPASLFGQASYYRIVGLASAEGQSLVAFPARRSLLGRLLPLPAGLAPGARGGLVRQIRASSPPASLATLAPVVFALDRPQGAWTLSLGR